MSNAEGSKRSTTPTSTQDHHTFGRYEIRLKGHLDARWAAWFDGLSLTCERDGASVLHGQIVDQAALHGVLRKVRDVGLPLLSVVRVEADQSDAATAESQ